MPLVKKTNNLILHDGTERQSKVGVKFLILENEIEVFYGTAACRVRREEHVLGNVCQCFRHDWKPGTYRAVPKLRVAFYH